MSDKSYLNQQETLKKNEEATKPTLVSGTEIGSSTDFHASVSTPPPGVTININENAIETKKAAESSDRRRTPSRSDRQRSTRRTDHSPITGPSSNNNIARSHVSRSRSRDRSRRQVSPQSREAIVGHSKLQPIGTGDKENRESRHRRPHSPRGSRRRSTSRGEKRPRSRETSPLREAISAHKHHSALDVFAADANGEKSSGEKERKRRKQRCRDYDEKGFCMKGDSCIYDHGPDPVVVEERALPRIIPGVVKSVPPLVDFSQPPPGYVHPPPPGVDLAFASNTVAAPNVAGGAASHPPEQYNPEAPALSSSTTTAASLVHSMAPPYGAHHVPQAPVCYPAMVQPPPTYTVQYTAPPGALMQPDLAMMRSRELVALGDGQKAQAYPNMIPPPTVPVAAGPHQRVVYHVGGHQRGPRPYYHQQPMQQHDKSCRTLEVRRIPPHLNTITKLNEHFSQFGQVVNIQICYNSDREAALVSFANRHQALSAYKSTTPVFNNRFVRMFWHNADGSTEPTQDQHPFNEPAGEERVSIKDRLGAVHGTESTESVENNSNTLTRTRRPEATTTSDTTYSKSVVTNSTGNLSKTVYNPAALKTAAAHKAQSSHVMTPSSDGAVLSGEVRKKQLELQKAKVDLFKKQLAQQKILLHQLEKCKDPVQKKEFAKMMKSTQVSLDKLNDELQKMKVMPVVVPLVVQQTKEQIERQLLDTELEMMNQRQAGSDTADLHNKLLELRRQVMLVSERNMAGFDGRNTDEAARPRRQSSTSSGRKIPHYANLDKRPRELLVSGFEEADKEALIEHFKSFGVVEDLEILAHHRDQPRRVLVVYKTRREAELALAGCKAFKDGSLDIQWYNKRTQLPSEKDEPQSELSAQDLLATLEDEEDEASSDDNEQGDFDDEVPEIERGWKRRS